MNVMEAFVQEKSRLASELESAENITETVSAIQLCMNRIASTLAQEDDDELNRQRVQAVLTVARSAPELLKGMTARGRLVEEITSEPKKIPQIVFWAGVILLAFVAVISLFLGQALASALIFLGILLVFLGDKKQQTGVRQRAEGIMVPDVSVLVRETEDLLRGVDIVLSDLNMIERESAVRKTSSENDTVMELLSSLLEARNSGREELVESSLSQVDQTLMQLDLAAVQYTPEHASWFDLLPTVGEERTLKPALVRNGKLVQRGLAVVTAQRGVS